MAKQQRIDHKQSRSDKQQEADRGTGRNGHEEEAARYEQELAGYLQERIKPGLNRGAIPLLARSIAKEIAHRQHPHGASEDVEIEDSAEAEDEHSAEADDEHSAEADDEHSAEADDEHSAEADDEPSADADSEPPPDFEADMHELQEELGEDWIVRFSVQGDDAWLTAEKDDGSQRVEAPTAAVLSEVVGLLNEGGGRST
jgi:hypothetical protein